MTLSAEKIFNINSLPRLVNHLKKTDKKLVLAGGFFDLLHIGHTIFLEEARKKGNCLLVLLESDETALKIKGEGRPINNQKNRAQVLAALESVDFVLLLPQMNFDKEYQDLIFKIKPDVIAVTKNDFNLSKKRIQAKMVSAKVVEIKKVPEKSTTKFLELVSKLKD